MKFVGGFGSYLFGMSPSIAIQNSDSSSPIDTKIPALGWMISFLFAVSFLGLFLAVPLRKLLIVDLKLPFSSATATADLISGYHTTKGARLTNEKIQTLGKYLSYSFAWGFFQWFFTAGEGCGFGNFPTFGLEAYKEMFYFDFSATYVGVGMLNQYINNISLLIGGILSWGIMWPFIEAKRGVWYPANLPKTNLSGFGGYQIFIPVGMVLGDGLYHFVKVLGHTLMCLYSEWNEKEKGVQSSEPNAHLLQVDSSDNKQTSKMFLKYQITYWFAVLGYVIISILSIIIILHIFHQLKWYYIAAFYIIAPAIVFCNAYGCGLTDYSLASTYGKLAILTISAWVGSSSKGGVTAGLVACGVMMSIVSTTSDMIQDFKTGYITLTSAKSMFLNQVIGTVMGCLIRHKTKAETFGFVVASGLICGDGIWSIPSSFLALSKVKPPICMKFLSRGENARYIRF
ncbi:hypothetical protein KIW84_021545 [Lathyrus oleraceus]|uniref:Metal-nicotianamine transporter YSL7 n=1 Tax=Pisum sativum TaxID=3888 RepID=A0A9D5B8R0_PEA|nr:hypothetical protein KIW84_021545 [Pisum sativum]